jgi:hypothetical protein
LSSYPPASDGLIALLRARIDAEPLNAIATAIFLLAVAHTFVAARFSAAAHAIQARRNAEALAAGRPPKPSVAAELLHFFGEVEVVFGLVVPLLGAVMMMKGWATAVHYLDETVNYTEPLFVVVIMALASSRPIIELAERAIGVFARRAGGTPAAWWASILILAPLLGSLITEPAAMTIAAVLLGRQFYARQPSQRLKYGTLGLLFVNVSIGGTLTHFAAPRRQCIPPFAGELWRSGVARSASATPRQSPLVIAVGPVVDRPPAAARYPSPELGATARVDEPDLAARPSRSSRLHMSSRRRGVRQGDARLLLSNKGGTTTTRISRTGDANTAHRMARSPRTAVGITTQPIVARIVARISSKPIQPHLAGE